MHLSDYRDQIIEQASRVRALLLDVDGVLSNGQLIFNNHGHELKAFNSKDGQGIKLLQQAGIIVGIITGRESTMVSARAAALGIEHVYQGQEDKQAAYESIKKATGFSNNAFAYMGDDLPDLAIMSQVGLSMTPADGHWFVRQHAQWQSRLNGGHGAVREACDFLLAASGKLDSIHRRYLP